MGGVAQAGIPQAGTPGCGVAAQGGAESLAILDAVLAVLDDSKAQDIVSIPLAGKSSIADYMVIASGSSMRQLAAMAGHLEERLKQLGLSGVGSEGGGGGATSATGAGSDTGGGWILIDGGDVIIHLFRPETREVYQLEKMWGGHPRPEI